MTADFTDVTCSFCGLHNRVVHIVGGRDGLTICSECAAKVAECLDHDTGLPSPPGGWSGRWPRKA